MLNHAFIREHGLQEFIAPQRKQIAFLETMIEDFDDGRSRSFFCRAACLQDLSSLEDALNGALDKVKTARTKPDHKKAKAKILRNALSGDTRETQTPP